MTDRLANRVLSRIQALKDQYERNFDIIAESVHEEIVRPFCRDNEYTFIAGMGSWCFWNKEGGQVEEEDLPDWLRNLLNEAYAPYGENDLGSLVQDVT